MNYVGKINEALQQLGGTSVQDYITVVRVGGEDHEPIFKATIELWGTVASVQGRMTKKKLNQSVCKAFLEQRGELD